MNISPPPRFSDYDIAGKRNVCALIESAAAVAVSLAREGIEKQREVPNLYGIQLLLHSHK